MRKQILFGIPILIALIGSASARTYVSASIGAIGQYPVGDFEPGLGGGGFGTLLIGSRTSLALTASSGYQYYSENDSIPSFSQIPIMGGLRLQFGETRFYASGELGAVIVRSANTVGVIHDRTNYGWDIGLGSQFGPMGLRILINSMKIRYSDDMYTIGASISFRIWDNY